MRWPYRSLEPQNTAQASCLNAIVSTAFEGLAARPPLGCRCFDQAVCGYAEAIPSTRMATFDAQPPGSLLDSDRFPPLRHTHTHGSAVVSLTGFRPSIIRNLARIRLTCVRHTEHPVQNVDEIDVFFSGEFGLTFAESRPMTNSTSSNEIENSVGAAPAEQTGRQPTFNTVRPGDITPHFTARCSGIDQFRFDTMAGRYLVLCFFASTRDEAGRSAIDAVGRHRDRFDDRRASFVGVSLDPTDEEQLRDDLPGIRFAWDFDAKLSTLLGAVARRPEGQKSPRHVRRLWLIIDPSWHILASFPFTADDPQHDKVFAFIDNLPHPDRHAGIEIPAPVLILPNVFEPELCRHLISLYDQHGGGETGVMRQTTDGRVAGVLDGAFKRRRDYTVDSPELIAILQARIKTRVVPIIAELFFMQITRMERYIVGCYAAEDGGHFRPHRDNNTLVTAHRRYAVSINLNADFEGGEVSFPEFNNRGHKAPPGTAVVFPCAILHSVSRVSKGRRYAFLPFVYDEAGARIRQENLQKAAIAADLDQREGSSES